MRSTFLYWIALSLISGTLSASGTPFIREYALGDPGCGPAIVAVDHTDSVWVALAKSGKLARYRDGAIETFDIGANSRPVGLAVAPDALWIAASYDNKILRFDLATHALREYAIDDANSWPFFAVVGNDGGIWFSQRAAGKIGRLDPATGTIRHFPIPTENAGPAGMAVDRASGRLWFTESYADRIASLDPATGTVTEYAMGEKSTGLVSGPAGIAVDHEGGVWFAKLEGKLGYLAKGASKVELIDTPAPARRPAGVIVDAQGAVWMVALDGNCLLRYDPKGRGFASYPLPTGEPDAKPSNPPIARTARPFGIAADRQGNIWFSEQFTGQLGVLDIAPPAVSIFAPGPVVKTASTLATARALDRVSGVRDVQWTIDGTAVQPVNGRIDVSRLAIGPHTLRVTATDHAGLTATKELPFTFSPGPFAVRETVERLKTTDAAKAALREAAAGLTGPDPRAALAALREQLAAHVQAVEANDVQRLTRFIDHAGASLGRNVEVKIVDAAPYFEPAVVEVHAGDTVLWKYDPPSDGHSISHNLHRVAIDGTGVSSNVLRAGESFSYRFEKAGQYAIRNAEKPGQQMALVKVVSP